MVKLITLIGIVACLGGCAPAISPTVAPVPEAPVKFADLQAHLEQYQGKSVTLGGEVMYVQMKDGNSLLEVNQKELGANLRPVDAQVSGGSFLVESSEWLSPNDYVKDRKVTVTGTVKGKQGDIPILMAQKIRLWEQPPWEKWYYPIPREWYDYDKRLEHWYTPPYYDPWRNGGRR